MDNFDRIKLEEMIKTNNVEDYTNIIRVKKHSKLITKDVESLLNIKKNYKSLEMKDSKKFDEICLEHCGFLFNNYMDIFNKVKKNEIDLRILSEFLVVLEEIEDGKLDQHEGSFKVGKLLKELYIDSALKKSNKLDDLDNKKSQNISVKTISYKEFKNNT